MMTSQQIFEKYLAVFTLQKHAQIPNVSLVPENDPTLLFVNSGMFPLVPYLMGEPHPQGTRLVNIQRCLRMEDINEVGDNRHTTMFHMLGNWSLNDYFRQEQLPWVFEFFIEHLKLDVTKLYTTFFGGDDRAPKDIKTLELIKTLYKKYGVEAAEGERVFACIKPNWWQRGDAIGELGGPSCELFYFLGQSPEGKTPEIDENEFIEIGNSVFLQYKKTQTGWEELLQKNVDFGGGLERIALAVQKKQDIFETDNFWPIVEKILTLAKISTYTGQKDIRILADHIRGAVFLAMDGITPSNKDQGYILRGLLRRIVRAGMSLGIKKDISVELVPIVTEMFAWLYPTLPTKTQSIQAIFEEEERKFRKTLNAAEKSIQKPLEKYAKEQPGNARAFANLASIAKQSWGLPTEIPIEIALEKGIDIGDKKDVEKYINEQALEHREQSKTGAEQKFKGGLAEHTEITTQYHTTTHVLQYALRKVLGEHVTQKGSNITNERLRFDFSHKEKLTEEELSEVEKLVNKTIAQQLPVKSETLSKDTAIKQGAIYLTDKEYGDLVTVYYIGNSFETALSKELCGGPHVENTGELKPIELYKQEKLGEGLLRLYARFP